jgi:hypothetical protein
MTAGGAETTGGTTSNQITAIVTTGQTVPLSAIPLGPARTTGRKLYRTVAGDTGSYLLLTTLNDNTTTVFSDTIADASLGAATPSINDTGITAAFPYPQLFMFSELIIICSPTVIYEWVSGSLVLKLTVTTGSPWTAIDYHGFIYMSNGVVAVTRTAGGVYATSSTLPVAQALIDVHGQVMAGGYL